jgi:hypothetical protein
MINIGFDFDIEVGLVWFSEYEKDIKDKHLLRKVE